MTDERRFPIQGGLTVSWPAAQRAYAAHAKRFGEDQSLERLAERGGFGLVEFAMLFDGRHPARDPRMHDDRFTWVLRESDVRRA